MWCGCSSLPKEERERALAKKDAKAASPKDAKPQAPPAPTKAGVEIPKQLDVEGKKKEREEESYDELLKMLCGMWLPDWHSSESQEPVLILQGLPFFKRKAILAQGLPSHVIEIAEKTVTVTSIKGSQMDKVTAPLLGLEKPITPSSILAISEDDETKESVKAYIADVPVSLQSLCKSPLLGKCLKIDHRYLNGDRKVDYHAVEVTTNHPIQSVSSRSKNKVKKYTTTHFNNRALGKEANFTIVSYREEPTSKHRNESKPEEETIPSAGNATSNQQNASSTAASSTQLAEVSSKVNATAESVKSGLGYVGAATVGAVVATDTVVTPKVTAWLLPPLKKNEVQKIESQQKHQAPKENVLELNSTNTGLDDITSWLTPSMQAGNGNSHIETSSVYSQQSRVSESFLVNPFSSTASGQKKTHRSKSDYAANKRKTGIMMEARAMSLLFPFSADESPRSVKENDGMYTFRDDDEEFKKVQTNSLQLLEQFKSK